MTFVWSFGPTTGFADTGPFQPLAAGILTASESGALEPGTHSILFQFDLSASADLNLVKTDETSPNLVVETQGGRTVVAQLWDDGLHEDGTPGDHIYGVRVQVDVGMKGSLPGTCQRTFFAATAFQGQAPRRFSSTVSVSSLDPCCGSTDPNCDSTPTPNLYPYLIGRGIHDITGPVADGGMMGYANLNQRSAGIHDRQWARAFIVGGRQASDPRVVFVVAENGQIFQSVTQGVLDLIHSDPELSPYYSDRNVVISATHTHSAAGGHSFYYLYNASIGGFAWQTYDALVHGIYMAIKHANADLAPGRILFNRGNLTDANENRNPASFQANVELNNPALSNPFGSDNRDTDMLVLRFEHADGREIGMLNWFPVHGVSIFVNNHLLSGDNKGYASYLFEQSKGTHYPGHGQYRQTSGFVAGFANSNEGDMTSNRRTLEPGGWTPNGEQNFEKAMLIGNRQYRRAMDLYSGAIGRLAALDGPVDSRHMYVDMSSVRVNLPDVYPYNVPGVASPQLAIPDSITYRGALGFDFARGSLDGEGLSQETFNFLQGLHDLFDDPTTQEFERWHKPKKVILTTGIPERFPADEGLDWTPQTVPISILRIGQLAVLAVPAECTIMAGSRLRKTVEGVMGPGTETVVAGLSNDYADYVTTYEEYVTQSNSGVLGEGYEEGSTQFGPLTLAAFQTKFSELARGIKAGVGVSSAVKPRTAPPQSALLKALDPIFDAPPVGTQTRAAVYKSSAGCGPGEFFDPIDGGTCWSCPPGYVRTLLPVFSDDACELPASNEYTGANKVGAPGCGPGEFLDPIYGGTCWSCPSDYPNRTIFPVDSSDACERPAYTLDLPATKVGAPGCGPGEFLDPIDGGTCWSCPSDYPNRTVFPVNSSDACERAAYTLDTGANSYGPPPGCGPGQFWDPIDGGTCWSCPSGSTRTIWAVNSSQACEFPPRDSYSAAQSVNANVGIFGILYCGNSDYPNYENGRCWRCPGGYNKLIFRPWSDGAACIHTDGAYDVGATEHGPSGCAPGQFWDPINGGTCWSCPSGYNRTIFPVDAGNACERIVPVGRANARRGGPYNCADKGPGWFWDPIDGGSCWLCPSGYSRTINPVNDIFACEQVVPAARVGANRGGYFNCADKGPGWFWDPIDGGTCWQCPGGPVERTIFPVDGGLACLHIAPAVPSLATRKGLFFCPDRGPGWFLDIGRNECWSCEGWTRNLNPVDGGDACSSLPTAIGDVVMEDPWKTPNVVPHFSPGQQVTVSFWGGHPKNVFGTVDHRQTDAVTTFLEVQLFNDGNWETVRTDADWDTSLTWERVGIAASKLRVTWNIGPTVPAGDYRILHRGYSLGLGAVAPYLGISPTFHISN